MILRGFHHGMDGLLEPEKDGWAIKLLVINLWYCTRQDLLLLLAADLVFSLLTFLFTLFIHFKQLLFELKLFRSY